MIFSSKTFDELTREELYQSLQLRSEVFVIEQNCIYQDIDGKDGQALHILGKKDGKIIAYARCFPSGTYFKEASIGRVVVQKKERKHAYGHLLIAHCIKAITNIYQEEVIKISAQQYLINFYEQHGFRQIGKGYLEDGIPHIAMLRKDNM